MMSPSNPFDFSDFGPQQRPGAPTGPPGQSAPSAPGQRGLSSGFDPWANQPNQRQPGRRPGPSTPADTFGSAGTAAFDPTSGRDAFGQLTAAPGGTPRTAGPPLVWFVVALALAVLGATLAGLSALGGPKIG